MTENAIGIFDSGLGGLTAVKELVKLLPNENVIYFGDTARVPYGNRSKRTIIRYAEQDADFLLSRGVKMIIAACGTVSSVAVNLKDELPVPFTGVVAPTAYAAAHATKNGRIGVIGTSATVNSGSYKNELLRLDRSFSVFQQDCPLFVSLVENSFISPDDDIVKLVVERYLKGLKEQDIDTLILGCTHFPIIAQAISNYLDGKVTLIDSGKETALYAVKLLEKNNLFNRSTEPGSCRYDVSDTVDDFRRTAEIFLGSNVGVEVSHINLEHAFVH